MIVKIENDNKQIKFKNNINLIFERKKNFFLFYSQRDNNKKNPDANMVNVYNLMDQIII